MRNYGIKIVVDNRPINSKEARDFVVLSDLQVMKTFRILTVGYTFSSDLATITLSIPHGLNDRPAIWLSFEEASHVEWNNFDNWSYYQGGGTANRALRRWRWYAFKDRIEIKYDELNVAGSGVDPTGEKWEFKLFIFNDKIG